MFKNVGASIKGIAKIVFWCGAIASVLIGISLMTFSELSAIFMLFGWIVIIMGVLFSWLSVLLLYAYGELVERTCKIEEKIGAKEKKEKQKNKETFKVEKKVQPAKTMPEVSNVLEDLEYIDFVCPKCGEVLSVEKGEKSIDCPFCGEKVNIN